MSSLLNPILGLDGWEAYAIVGALCFGEAALLIGFFLPGETAVVLGGVLASQDHVSIVVMVIVVIVCAIVGDSVGFELKRWIGPPLLERRPLRGNRGVARALELVRRRGAGAVFIGRFMSVVRALVPGVAGVSGMRYRNFLIANAIGGAIWGTLYTFAGYAVGASYKKVLSTAGTASSIVLGVAVFLIVSFIVIRKLRERRENRAFKSCLDRDQGDS